MKLIKGTLKGLISEGVHSNDYETAHNVLNKTIARAMQSLEKLERVRHFDEEMPDNDVQTFVDALSSFKAYARLVEESVQHLIEAKKALYDEAFPGDEDDTL